MKRRNFIQNTALGSLGVVAGTKALASNQERAQSNNLLSEFDKPSKLPLVIATWNVPNATQSSL